MNFFNSFFLNQSIFSCQEESAVGFEEERQIVFKKFKVRTKGENSKNNNKRDKSKRRSRKNAKSKRGSSKNRDAKSHPESTVKSKDSSPEHSTNSKHPGGFIGSPTKTSVLNDIISSQNSLVCTDSVLPALIPAASREQETIIEFFSPCYPASGDETRKESDSVEVAITTSTSDDGTATTRSLNTVGTPPDNTHDISLLQLPPHPDEGDNFEGPVSGDIVNVCPKTNADIYELPPSNLLNDSLL